MSKQKTILVVDGPILAGTLSEVRSKCGKSECRCSSGKTKDLHGPYHRWSGYIDSRLTHRTLTEDAMRECKRRIANYHELQSQLVKTLESAIQNAPWLDAKNSNKPKS
jgi:hypothetical protein